MADEPKEKRKCGARRARCPKCRYRFKRPEERELLACPHCGEPRFCTIPPVVGHKRCLIHGGKAPSGTASPRFKNGKYAKVNRLAPELLKRVEELADDPELLSCKHDIEIASALSGQLAEKILREPTVAWDALASVAKEVESARDNGDDFQPQLDLLLSFIKSGAANENAKEEWMEWAQKVAKLKDLETKMQERKNSVMTYEQAMKLVFAMLAVTQKHVSDKLVLEAMSKDINGLLTFTDVPKVTK